MTSLEKIHEIKDDIFIASGSTHLQLAEDTAAAMGLSTGDIQRKQFPNTEQYVRYKDSVRGKHIFAIQSLAAAGGRSVNDSLMELILMVDAAKRASASEITVVAPYLAYSRQDRKSRGREPISVAAVVNMLQATGADRIVSLDVHSPQTQGIFDGPFDHATAESSIQSALKEEMRTNKADYVIVSPDGGRAKLAEDYGEVLNLDVLHMPKGRKREDSSHIKRPDTILGVDGRTCIMVDDMIDTAGTLKSAAETLRNSGSERNITCATHPIFSGRAMENLHEAPIDVLMVTDTVPTNIARVALKDKIRIITIAPLLGETLGEIAIQGSVSRIFSDRNHQ